MDELKQYKQNIKKKLSLMKSHLIKMAYAIEVADRYYNPKSVQKEYKYDPKLYHDQIKFRWDKILSYLEDINDGRTLFSQQSVESNVQIFIEKNNKLADEKAKKEYEFRSGNNYK
jgi:hypothetical protein